MFAGQATSLHGGSTTTGGGGVGGWSVIDLHHVAIANLLLRRPKPRRELSPWSSFGTVWSLTARGLPLHTSQTGGAVASIRQTVLGMIKIMKSVWNVNGVICNDNYIARCYFGVKCRYLLLFVKSLEKWSMEKRLKEVKESFLPPFFVSMVKLKTNKKKSSILDGECPALLISSTSSFYCKTTNLLADSGLRGRGKASQGKTTKAQPD